MDRIWLDAYPPGVPADIAVPPNITLREVFEESCRRFAGHRAFSNLGGVLTYEELDRSSAAFAAWLQREAGLQPGDRVALMMPNILQYPVALFGALRAGLVAVNVNPLYTARELAAQLNDSGARAIVILENFAHSLETVYRDSALETIVVTSLGDLLPGPRRLLVNAVVRYVRRAVPAWRIPDAIPLRDALTAGAGREPERVPMDPRDPAFLQYTGGTTGTAKGAILSHRNMIANLEQASAWLRGHLSEGEEVVLTALPLYHIFSLLANCLLFMRIGGENVLVTNPRDLPALVKTLQATRPTAMTGVNTLFNALLNTPSFDHLNFDRLKLTLGGGMAVQRGVAERWHAVTGHPIVEAYGLTETSPAVCVNPLDIPDYTGSIGLPLPSTEVSIRDEHGTELPPGEVGELCVRGPQVTSGYWQQHEATQRAFHADDFFRTGDLARIGERGFVYIVDRLKDMAIVSGFNVYPNEVEEVLISHPDVAEAAVIGVPDERQGERLRAFVVPRGPGLTAETLISHCRQSLTGYKVPQDIVFRDELPKTNVGKILRRALREPAGGGDDAGEAS
ncbi:AMP-binding protein [Arhodomonas sp. AD133]|uniref:AMP-binding protein n=1 Tax=Arhodomonas sp. AD133 TaxID=3415009 RepID=UPI003EBCF16E